MMKLAWLALPVVVACGSPDVASDAGDAGGNGTDGALVDAGGDVASDASTDGPGADGGDAGTTKPGAGKTSYTCPTGATKVQATDDLEAAVAASKANDTICIYGVHRIQNTISPKSGQTWIGITTDATISGAAVLSGWTKSGNAWVYSGALAATPPHTQLHYANAVLCYQESQYQDDVFWNDQRLFRVLSLAELGATGPLADGMVQPSVEPGRFFFDYTNDKIYVSVDPTSATVELALLGTIIGQATSPSKVTLENITVEKGLAVGVAANTSTEWTLTDMTVRFIHNRGMFLPAGTDATHRTQLVGSLFTNNGQYALDSTASWVVLRNTELSWNNIASYRNGPNGSCAGYYAAGAAKLVQSLGTPTQPGIWLDGVDSHDNVGDGFWTDVHNRYVLVENSTFHDNERNGYFHEISCDIEIRNSTAYGNGRAIVNADLAKQGFGIFVSDSSNADVHDNVIHDNAAGGVQLEMAVGHASMTGIACIAPPANDTDTSTSLTNNKVHANQIYACAGHVAGAAQNASTGFASLLAPRGNAFVQNAYHTTDKGNWWVDISPMNWTAWQSVDTTGTITTSCAYP